MRALGVSDYDAFLTRAGVDFRFVWPEYVGPCLKTFGDGSREDIWGVVYGKNEIEGGFYTEPVYRPHEKIDSVREAGKLRFPEPDWHDYSNINKQIDDFGGNAVLAGSMGHFDFINGVAFGRGYERVMTDIADENPVYLYLVEKRFDYFYGQLDSILSAGNGRIDAVQMGEDLGSQLGPLISPRAFEKLFARKYEAAFKLAHGRGAKTMLHCCGAVRAFLPLLIELGLDILDVVHVDAAGMELSGLKKDFGDKLAFSGTLSVQTLLNGGTPEEIKRAIESRKALFKEGGLMLGPCNVLQADMPFENFVAMCEGITGLKIK